MASRCEQCGVTSPVAMHHEDHGDLCSLCASRQMEADNRRGLISPGTLGFIDDDAERWDG